ncbi:hypothetical protein [Halobaculum marinum]|uniref:Uncharacterized protein n=1 Tax=Halobaculum marinum TaxID=3031996 RepID=A0ABD5WWK1_9EURY|nr:hypothetical protein [Halobaculum sp. DT55]
MSDREQIPAVQRRRLLAGVTTTAVAATSGCLGWFGDANAEPPGGWQTAEFTTAQSTETFSFREGTRTPYPGVRQIYTGGGTLVLVCFDYAHRESIRWWREEFPKLSDLLEADAFRPTLLMFPVPVDEWSMLLPSAVFEVRARGDRADAWAFHEGLVDAAPDYSFDLLRDLASTVEVDGDAVVEAARTRRRRNQTRSDREFARGAGVEAEDLPAFRWGREPIDADTTADLREFIEEHR